MSGDQSDETNNHEVDEGPQGARMLPTSVKHDRTSFGPPTGSTSGVSRTAPADWEQGRFDDTEGVCVRREERAGVRLRARHRGSATGNGRPRCRDRSHRRPGEARQGEARGQGDRTWQGKLEVAQALLVLDMERPLVARAPGVALEGDLR